MVPDDYTSILYIELGGTKGTSATNSWFTIDEVEELGAYQIKYCPRNGMSVCGALGIVSDEAGLRHLGVNNHNPLAFTIQSTDTFVNSA